MEKIRVALGITLIGTICLSSTVFAKGFYDERADFPRFEIEMGMGYMNGEALLEYGDTLELADGVTEEVLPFPNDDLKINFSSAYLNIRTINRLTYNTHFMLNFGKTMQSNTGPVVQSTYDDNAQVTNEIEADDVQNEVIRVDPKLRYYIVNSDYKENGKKQLYIGLGYMYQDIYVLSDAFTQTTGGTSTSVTGNEWVQYHANIQFPYLEVGLARTMWFDTLVDATFSVGAATIVDRWEDGLNSLKTEGNHVGSGGTFNLRLSWDFSRHYTAFINTRLNYITGVGQGNQERRVTTGDGPAGEIGDYNSKFQNVDMLFTVGFGYKFIDK